MGIVAIVALSAAGVFSGRTSFGGPGAPQSGATAPGASGPSVPAPGEATSPLGRLGLSAPRGDRVVDATVGDAETGEPIPDARITVGSASLMTDATGRYRLTRLRPGDRLVVTADGYTRQEILVGDGGAMPIALR